MKAIERGDVYAMPILGGKWGAVQVLAIESKDKVEIATLDAMWDAPPTVKQLVKRKVQRQDWGSWEDRPDRVFVDARVPPEARFVANIPVVETFDEPCLSYSAWGASAPFWSWRWNVALTKKDRARYHVGIDMDEIPIDLGAGPGMLRKDTWRLRLGGEHGEVPLPKTKVKWSALDVFGLTEIDYTGSDPGFLAFVRSQRTLNTVRWRQHGQSKIDLRDTLITHLVLDAAKAPVKVIAPRYLDSLTLGGAIERFTIDLAHVGHPFGVTFEGKELPKKVVSGLEKVQSLEAWHLADADLRRLAFYGELDTLVLRGAPGSVTHVEALAKLAKLRGLRVYELWDFDGEAFPSGHPALESVEIVGLRQSSAAALKKKLAKVPHVRIKGAKTDEWIQENLANPFRGWEEDDPRLGKAAMAAWKKASAAVTKAGPKAPVKTAEKILKSLVDTLNVLDGKHGLDTIRREEAGEAFLSLAERFPKLDAKTAETWFDAWRDF